MLNVKATYYQQDDFWPAFWRATLLKLDILAIFMSISAVVYIVVSWIAAPVPVASVETLAEVKTQYHAAVAAREPQSVARPVAHRQAEAKPVPTRVRAPQAVRPAPAPAAKPARLAVKSKTQNAVKAKAPRAAVADAQRLSEKSRRN